MKTIKYIIAVFLVQCFCALLLFSQTGETKKNINKIIIADELPVIFIGAQIRTDTLKPLYIFTNTDSLSLTDSTLPEKITCQKISAFNLAVYYKKYEANGSFSLYENNVPFIDFSNGGGNSLSFAAGYEFYISNRFSFEMNLVYDQLSTSSSTDYLLPIIDDKYAKTEHTAELNIRYLSSNILLKYEIFDNAQIMTGFQYGFLLNSKYNHIVKIKSDEITYDNVALEKHFDDRTLANTNNVSALLVGASYRIPFIAENYGLEFSGMYEMGLNKIFNNTDLKTSALSFGIKLICIF